MSCPTCNHTMHRIGNSPVVWWCPNCGTIKAPGLDREIETPRGFTALREALEGAKRTIKNWHAAWDEDLWELYQKSPEMQQINNALEATKGREAADAE